MVFFKILLMVLGRQICIHPTGLGRKKITDQATVDLNVYYWEESKMKLDVFQNFETLEDDYRMTYSSHWGHGKRGNIVNIRFLFFSFRFFCFKNV